MIALVSKWLCIGVLISTCGIAQQSEQRTSGPPSSGIWHDPSPHAIHFVTVDEGVQLEVLDWGGAGRAVVLLSGFGGTAHIFDDFAPKLARFNHVYGVTRRGFGASSVPQHGYEADRLGDDVLVILNSLKLYRPVLVGVSLGGEELSSVASRDPDRVGGLVYLDAAYPYAFDNGKGMSIEELFTLMQKVPQPAPPSAADLVSFGAYQSWLRRISGVTVPEAELRQTMDSKPDGSVGKSRISSQVQEAIFAGMRKYSDLRVPVLAMYAILTQLESTGEPAQNAATDAFLAQARIWTEKQAKAFEDGVSNARVIRLPGARHAVFLSNEADVLREMRAFLATLK